MKMKILENFFLDLKPEIILTGKYTTYLQRCLSKTFGGNFYLICLYSKYLLEEKKLLWVVIVGSFSKTICIQKTSWMVLSARLSSLHRKKTVTRDFENSLSLRLQGFLR